MGLKTASIALIAFIATSRGDDVWDGFSARWSLNVSNGFYAIPQNLTTALQEGWTGISGADPLQNATALGYYGDPLFVLLFSPETKKLIGIQVSLRVSDIDPVTVPINYTANPALKTKTLNGEKYYSATAYFHQNEENGTREIWVDYQDGLMEIPTTSELLESKLPSYTLGPCVKWMGVHYYKMGNVTDCSAIFPWLLLMVEGNIVGIGFLSLGNTTAAAERTWFETFPNVQQIIRSTILGAPACLAEAAVEYGYSLFHTWFLSNPTNIVCNSTFVASN